MQDIPRKAITLVLGGVRSGKSRFAQTLAARISSVAFVATAQPLDEEMHVKIQRHQAERPKEWRWTETPCRWCPQKRMCKADIKADIVNVDQSCTVDFAKTVDQKYDPVKNRRMVIKRWKEKGNG